MGIIYNSNVEEKELYSAYGMTVYGKENDYDWTIYPDRPREKCYISLRINNGTNDIINITLGNRCIFKENFDRTIDNFLYWIDKDFPFDDAIENAVFKSLTCTDSIFNHRIEMRKYRERQEEEQRKRIEERQVKEKRQLDIIKEYCDSKGLVFYQDYTDVYLLKATNNNDRNLLAEAMNDKSKMQMVINFMRKYPGYNGIKVVKHDTIENILNYIK